MIIGLTSTALTPASRTKISRAIANATDDGQQPEIPGKVVAELMLGFWWSLLADQYNRRLWQTCLQRAIDGPVRRGRLHRALDDLRRLSNRIAHHEPIHTRNLHHDHTHLVDTAGRISPILRTRIEATTRIPAILNQRPQSVQR